MFFRILLNRPSASLLGEFYQIVTDSTDGTDALLTVENISSQYSVDFVDVFTPTKVNKNATELVPKFQNLNIQNNTIISDPGSLDFGMYSVEMSVLEWLEPELEKIIENAPTYYTHTASAVSSSLQLSFVCSVLLSLTYQIEALINQQNEAHTEMNFTDYSGPPISPSLHVPPVTPHRDPGSVPGNMEVGGTPGVGTGSNLGPGTGVESRARLLSLRCVCSRVLSKYRGVSLSLLSSDAVKDTSRFR